MESAQNIARPTGQTATEAIVTRRTTKKKPGVLSRLNSWLHLWLGITSGLVVIVVALSGTIFVFADDMIDVRAGAALRVQEVKAVRLTPEQLIAAFKKDNPGLKPFYFVAYKDPERTFKIGSANKQQQFKFSWLDPYTGKTLTTDGAYYFFYVVAHIHSQLLLHETGGWIVQIATWIFLVELITGLILWWPKKWNKASRKICFTIKWNGKFKRVNYDLHNVLGFYTLIPALVLTVTGLIIVNETLNKATHAALGGKHEAFASLRKSMPAYSKGAAVAPVDSVLLRLFRSGDDVTQVRMTIPAKDSVTGYFTVAGSDIGLKGYKGRLLLVNKYTGTAIPVAGKLKKAELVESTNMNIHIGYFWGWFGKMIMFVGGLVATSLPVTGFLIWWGRKKKSGKKTHSRKQIISHA